MTTEFPYDVVLRATNQADKPRVQRQADRLRAAGRRQSDFGFRISNFGFPPQAAWVGLERSTVLFRGPANAGRRLIQLLLADCKLQGLKARKKTAQGKRSETSAALGHLPASFSSPGRAQQVPGLVGEGRSK